MHFIGSSLSRIIVSLIGLLLGQLLLILPIPLSHSSAFGDEIDEARREVERVEAQVAAVRRQYDALASQVALTQSDLDLKQANLVSTTLKLLQTQEYLDSKVSEFNNRVRQAYKDGPGNDIQVFLASESLAEFWAARRYVALRLERDKEVLAELEATQESLAELATELELGKSQIQERLDQLANLLDQTQTLLADSEAALAASRADLQLKEEIRKAMELINRGSPAGRRPISERHRRATENQSVIIARYPFGPVAGIPDGLVPTGEVVEGIASWYGPGFNGLPTASGAIYDENLYTCASKELPLGTILLVSHKGRSVLVLVNDRGPFVRGRVLDLSRAAKDAIGMGGLGYVTAQVLEPV